MTFYWFLFMVKESIIYVKTVPNTPQCLVALIFIRCEINYGFGLLE